MRSRLIPLFLAGLAAGLALVDPPRSASQEPPLADEPPAGVEVQARGAVHEAYAEPNGAQPVPGPVVEKDPPRRVEEAPPEEKPEGDNVLWIPGYWSWDEERSDFVWISGFWRAVPPGRTWVPGSWQRAGAGHRWVSGYWGVAGQDETQYLPRPPESLDNGPSTPAPGENYNYVPGNWYYQTTRYVWRPGYWVAFRPGWVWTPACYRWTPCGYIYVPGFWDVPLLDRGLLFAPVCFTSAVYLNPGFVYRPAYCIQPDFLCGALFVRRGFGGGYFFGDYFGAPYRSRFTAWTSFRFGGGVGIDLNFGYYRNAFRGNPGWERGLNGLYAGRFAGHIAAPPRTLVQQRTVINNIVVNKTTNNIVNKNVNITNVQNSTVLAPVKNIKKVNVTALSSLAGPGAAAKPPAAVTRDVRLARLSPAQLAEEKRGISRYQAIAAERRNIETKLVAKAPTEKSAPIRAKLELPKDTPPARVVKTPTPPPSPVAAKVEAQPETRPGKATPAPKGSKAPPMPKPDKTPLPPPAKGDKASPLPTPKGDKAPPPALKGDKAPPPPTPRPTPPPVPKGDKAPPPAPRPPAAPPSKGDKAPPPPPTKPSGAAPPPAPRPDRSAPAPRPSTPPPAAAPLPMPRPATPPPPAPRQAPPPPAPRPAAAPPAPRPAPPAPLAKPDKPEKPNKGRGR